MNARVHASPACTTLALDFVRSTPIGRCTPLRSCRRLTTMRLPAPRTAAFLALSLVLAHRESVAQELEPRSYAASPTGLNLAIGGFARSTGEVLPDPSAPI